MTVGELEMKKGTVVAFKSPERYSTYKRIDKGILRELTRVASEHRLNMKLNLQSLFGLLWTALLTPPPAFGFIYEGAIG
jgi:hypothetical protein